MRSDLQDDVSLRGRFLFIVFVAAPLVVWLAAPPILQSGTAEEVCTDLLAEAEDEAEEPVVGEVAWRSLPAPHWSCTIGAETLDLGWWAADDD